MDISVLVASHLATLHDLGAMEDDGVHDDSRESRKRDTIGQRKEGRQEQWRVFLVRGNVEGLLGGEDSSDVVCRPSVVEGMSLSAVRGTSRDTKECVVGGLLTLAIGRYWTHQVFV